MVAEVNSISRAERLAQAQQNAARMRTAAFVPAVDVVCGIRLKPVTLDSFNALDAFGNAFFHGGGVTFLDVVNFVWIHHPEFGQFNRKEKARVTRRVWRALNPRFPGINALFWFAAQLPRFRWLRHLKRASAADRMHATVDQIRAIMREATQDMPRGNSNEGEPIPYAFPAHMLNTLRRSLGITFEEARSMPMKQLAEHYREIIHTNSHGKALLLTQEEEDIFTEDLAAKTAALPKKPEGKKR